MAQEEAAQQGVQWTGGYAARFLSFVVALSFFRFDGESTLPPQAANASRWALHCENKLESKCLEK